MSNYHIYFEKNQNTMYMQDFSRYNRTKLRIDYQPYLLEHDMVLEIGGSRCFVKKIFPKNIPTKKQHKILYINTRDSAYPLKEIFEGQYGREYTQDEIKKASKTLDSFEELHTRKMDFRHKEDIEKFKMNPFVELEFMDGPLKSKTFKMKKDVNYQIKAMDRRGNLPEVKQEYILGKGMEADFDLESFQARNYQCTIFFDDDFGWCVRDDHSHFEIGSNFVYLANRRQVENNRPSKLVGVMPGMVVQAGEYEFKWDVVNLNGRYDESEIYDEEDSLMEVEKEEDEILTSFKFG